MPVLEKQELNAGEFHEIWESGDIQKVLRRAMKISQASYILWRGVYYGLGLFGFVSLGFAVYAFPDAGSRASIAIAFTIWACFFGSQAPERKNAAETAVQMLWKARLLLQQNEEGEAWKLAIVAVELLMPGVIMVRPGTTKQLGQQEAA